MERRSRRASREDSTAGVVYKVTKESPMTLIAVYGDAIDKIGFQIARKANLMAQARLTKTLTTYTEMASKTDARLRKQRDQAGERLQRLQLNQQRLVREYATRGATEVGTTASGLLLKRARALENSGIVKRRAQEEAEERIAVLAAQRLLANRGRQERMPGPDLSVLPAILINANERDQTLGESEDFKDQHLSEDHGLFGRKHTANDQHSGRSRHLDSSPTLNGLDDNTVKPTTTSPSYLTPPSASTTASDKRRPVSSFLPRPLPRLSPEPSRGHRRRTSCPAQFPHQAADKRCHGRQGQLATGLVVSPAVSGQRSGRPVIVPDKREMLAILEQQNRQLQRRVNRFLDDGYPGNG